MSLSVYGIDEKIEVLGFEIERARAARRSPGSEAHRRYEVLKAISNDLRGRQQLPRSNALGELERAIQRAIGSKTALGYDAGRLADIANVVVNKWATISQALEQFGEESAE